MAITILGRLLIVALVIGGFLFLTNPTWNPGESQASTTPRSVEFKELVLDAQSLGRSQAYVEVSGVYAGLSSDLEVLYPPTHTPLSMGDDGIRLLTNESPRDVREFLYDCRQRDAASIETAACHLRATGRMNICHLQIAAAAEYPCLQIERVSVVR